MLSDFKATRFVTYEDAGRGLLAVAFGNHFRAPREILPYVQGLEGSTGTCTKVGLQILHSSLPLRMPHRGSSHAVVPALRNSGGRIPKGIRVLGQVEAVFKMLFVQPISGPVL